MMTQNVETILSKDRVAALKEAIIQDCSKAPQDFFEFAKTYAQNKKHLNEATMLKRGYSTNPQEDKRNLLNQKVLQLIDNITEDYQENEVLPLSHNLDAVLRNYISKYSYSADPILTVKHISKSYRRGNFKINDINFDLEMGEIIGVVGENGNGKTTMFEMLAGNLAHDDGEISFPLLQKGAKLNWADIKPHIAYLAQELPKWKGDLRENLHYTAAINGLKGAANIREVDFIVERFDLNDYLDHTWGSLAGGYKARFSLARALIAKPKLLIMDELLANLDFKAQINILNDIRDFVSSFKYPMAAIISTQHLHEIERLADRLLFLKHGQLSFIGTTEDIQCFQKDQKFEIDCDLSLERMKAILKEFPLSRVTHDGQCFVVTVSANIEKNQILKLLVKEDINVKYFRDISGSVKRLFL